MNKKRLSQKVSAVALNVFYRKQVAPLIRPKLRFVHLPPKGKAISKAVVLNSNGFATIRYETGDARPPKGKAISKAVVLISNGFAAIRYETGEARPQGEAYERGINIKFKRFCNNPLRNG